MLALKLTSEVLPLTDLAIPNASDTEATYPRPLLVILLRTMTSFVDREYPDRLRQP